MEYEAQPQSDKHLTTAKLKDLIQLVPLHFVWLASGNHSFAVSHLSENTFSEEEKEEWADVLNAPLREIRGRMTGVSIVCEGIPVERLIAFADSLNDRQTENIKESQQMDLA